VTTPDAVETDLTNDSETSRLLRFLRWLGDRPFRGPRAFLAFIGGLTLTLVRGLRPSNWNRTLRAEFQLYCFQVGVKGLPAVVIVAVLIGVGMLVEGLYWLGLFGQRQLLGDLLALALIREIAPTTVMLIVIGRSGSVMLDEIGQMVTGGQLRMLSSHGIDPLYYLLIPRTFAVAVSVFVLTVVFLPVAIISGFLAASALGVTNLSALDFADEVLSAAGWADYLLIPVKTLITGYIIGFISCVLGLEVQAGVHGIRRQLPKAFVLSLIATFLVGGLTSVLL